jgi:hypothetical protein
MSNIEYLALIRALIDLLDSNSIDDIVRFTGLSYERRKEIKDLYIELIKLDLLEN